MKIKLWVLIFITMVFFNGCKVNEDKELEIPPLEKIGEYK